MKQNRLDVETYEILCARCRQGELLITTYQEINDLFWSNTCCNDENVQVDRNIDLPEQQFF